MHRAYEGKLPYKVHLGQRKGMSSPLLDRHEASHRTRQGGWGTGRGPIPGKGKCLTCLPRSRQGPLQDLHTVVLNAEVLFLSEGNSFTVTVPRGVREQPLFWPRSSSQARQQSRHGAACPQLAYRKGIQIAPF